MTARKPLRAVKPGDIAPAKRKPQTIARAAEGSARDLLVALRDRIAKTLDEPNCPARDQASLSKRLMEIQRDIEAIDARALLEDSDAGPVEDEAWDSSAL